MVLDKRCDLRVTTAQREYLDSQTMQASDYVRFLIQKDMEKKTK